MLQNANAGDVATKEIFGQMPSLHDCIGGALQLFNIDMQPFVGIAGLQVEPPVAVADATVSRVLAATTSITDLKSKCQTALQIMTMWMRAVGGCP